MFFWGNVTLFTSLYIDVFARLKHWLSDYLRQDTDCKVVLFLLTYLRMFSHVYFVLKLVLMWRRWSVHVRLALSRLLNWGATAICHSTLNSAKRHLLFEYCNTMHIIWNMRFCFILKVPKHNAYCDILDRKCPSTFCPLTENRLD